MRETGSREIPAAAVVLLEEALGTGGRLTSAAAPDAAPAPARTGPPSRPGHRLRLDHGSPQSG